MIGVEQIQPLCKVECLNTNCEFHLETRYFFGCNLKHIMISQTGECIKYQKILRTTEEKKCAMSKFKRTTTENKVDDIKKFLKKDI